MSWKGVINIGNCEEEEDGETGVHEYTLLGQSVDRYHLQVVEYHQDYVQDYVDHNETHCNIIYPYGRRLESSNAEALEYCSFFCLNLLCSCSWLPSIPNKSINKAKLRITNY